MSDYTVKTVLGWNFANAKTVSASLTSRSTEFANEVTRAAGAFDSSWEYWKGYGGEEARQASQSDAEITNKSATVIGDVAEKFNSRVSELEGEIEHLRAKVQEAEDSEYSLRVKDDGSVYSTKSNFEWLRIWKAAFPVKIADKEAAEGFFTAAIRGSLARVEDIDRRGSEELRSVLERLPDSVKLGATGVPSDPRLAEILLKYQTDASRGGARLWPSGALLETIRAVVPGFEPQFLTPEEVAMLTLMAASGPAGPAKVAKVFEIRSIADDVADSRHVDRKGNGPKTSSDGHGDAFRHTFWNALMTKEFGAEWTERFATAHEGLGGNLPSREAMDLYNNEVGRRIATAHPDASPRELADLVDKAVRDGETLVINSDNQIAWSDQVREHHTGKPPLTDIPLPAGGN
ncbi:DUF6973 domain-containing protein [Gordonia westfalica]|uniref:DUF6973 domain-containing protein n=1 Tax=Gordonia westfalica TaxID=158898 RepID=A0A1H2HN26_9ACTN|nr:hypothetical protein [Gordonia westfalica]SDU33247.1 hypothetical protein SAMN04488548_134567 [Gordonia westfalica]